MVYIKIPIPLVGRLEIVLNGNIRFTPREKPEPAHLDYSVDEMKNIAMTAQNWGYAPFEGAFCSYAARITDTITETDGIISEVTLAHFSIPRGSGSYENSRKWYNQLRCSFLDTFSILGRQDMVRLEVIEKRNHPGRTTTFKQGKTFTRDAEVVGLYKHLHEKLKARPTPQFR